MRETRCSHLFCENLSNELRDSVDKPDIELLF